MKKKEKIKINYTFKNITDETKKTIQELVERQFETKLSAYLMKKELLNKDNAIGTLKVNIEKNEKGKYLGKLIFNINEVSFVYENKIPFSILNDIIIHGFKRFKEKLSGYKDSKNNNIKNNFKEDYIKKKENYYT